VLQNEIALPFSNNLALRDITPFVC